MGLGGHCLQRVTIGRSTRDRCRADVSIGPDTILNDNRLPELHRQLFADQTGGRIHHAAGRPSDDDLQRPVRVLRLAR